ncbi:hypothetical protein HY624_03730 [Candidatus Uhrbacteria bacterium]|nr:hypothetical protein [Candidatus Uhrbacteria bacterium]
MFVDVAPCVRLPRSQTLFTYIVPENLEENVRVGAIVEIEFRKKRIRGCVFGIHENKPTGYAPLPMSALVPKVALTRTYCAFIQSVANDTFTSLAAILHDVVPTPPRRASPKRDGEKTGRHTSPSIPRSLLATLKESEEMCARESPIPFLLHTADASYISAFLTMRLNHAIRTHERTLVLFPTHERMTESLAALPERIQDATTLFHAQLSSGAYWRAWNAVQSGTPCVMGTRSALFAPGRWHEIIVIDEEHAAHKQEDQSPRYSTHRLVALLANCYASRTIFVGSSPRVTTWHAVHGHHVPAPRIHLPLRMIDMRDGKHAFGIVHAETLAAIQETVAKNKHVAVFIARGGYAGSISCAHCGTMLTCTLCRRPYTADAQNGSSEPNTLICIICKTTSALPSQCVVCHSSFFTFHGTGVKRIASMFGELIQKTRMEYIHIQTHMTPIAHPIALVVVLSSEALLHYPDFRSAEWTYQWLTHIAAWAHASQARCILQSWNPEHHVFAALAQNNPERFYAEELRQRCAAFYPPFVRSALVTLKTPVGRDRVAQHTLPMSRFEKAGILVSDPYIRRGPSPRMIHTSVYLRHPLVRKEEEFTQTLRQIPDPWLIDREPERIF